MVRHQARHGAQAEKLFGRFVADQKPVPTQVASEAAVPTAPELVAPVRVLPDLLAVAREEERRAGEAPKRKRAATGAGTTKPRKKSEQARTQVGVRVTDPPAQPSGMLNGHAEAAMALSAVAAALHRSCRLDSGGKNVGCPGCVGIAEADHQHLRVRSTRRGRWSWTRLTLRPCRPALPAALFQERNSSRLMP